MLLMVHTYWLTTPHTELPIFEPNLCLVFCVMMYCVKLYRHIYVYIRLMLCGCYAPNDTAVLIWKECCVAATHTMILPVRKIHGHSITWKTTWCEKYEVRKVELSVTVVILTKLILSDTKTFILICTFTVLISKK